MTLSQKIFLALRRERSIHFAAAASFATAVAVAAFVLYVGATYPKAVARQVSIDANKGIQAELDRLSSVADRIAADPTFASLVASKDYRGIDAYLSKKKSEEGVSRFAVMDPQGFITSRTEQGYLTGDNAFLQSPPGRLIASGVPRTQSVEAGNVNPRELFLVSSVPIPAQKGSGGSLGTLFATSVADDAFAARFAASAIGRSARVAFYRPIYGIFGSSIVSARNKQILDAQIQTSSDQISQLDGAAVFKAPDSQVFLAQDLKLKGAEGETGGLIVFVPMLGLIWISLVGSLLPFFVFMAICVALHKRPHRRPSRRTYYPAALALGGAGTIVALAVFFIGYESIPSIKESRYPLYNSILSIQPESGVFDKDAGQRVSVVLDAGDEPINAIGIRLSYDPSAIRVESVDTSESVCEHFVSQESDEKGAVGLECIVPSPGYQGKGAKVADVYIKALRPGPASISFAEGTRVLANDGLGTDVLRQAVGGSFLFEDRPSATASTSVTAFSVSHPNASRWYASRKVAISWIPRVPVNITATGPGSFHSIKSFDAPPATIEVPADGEYRFEVARKDGSARVSLVKARVDATPPEHVVLQASETAVKAGSIVRFIADAKDAGSGVQRASYVKIDNDLFFPIGREIHIPFLDAGAHTVTLRSYDNAGNHTDATQAIQVDP